jgi:hypothetical protein
MRLPTQEEEGWSYLMLVSLGSDPLLEYVGDFEKLKVLEAEFRAKSMGGVWKGQVLAVDGVHFGQLNPGTAVENSLKYFVSRKDKYALLCIAGCYSECRYLAIDISQLPTTHDSIAWAATALGRSIGTGDFLFAVFFINADNAFNLEEWMMVPVNDGAHLDFDYHQSLNRVVIERAFGILIRRWVILWGPLIKCLATGCGEAIVKAFDPRTREYTAKASAFYSRPRWLRLPPRRPPPRKLPPPWKLSPPRKPPPMRLTRKRLYRPSCRKSLVAARTAWPRTPRRSPGGQRN